MKNHRKLLEFAAAQTGGRLGLPLSTLAGEDEERNWYAFVFLE